VVKAASSAAARRGATSGGGADSGHAVVGQATPDGCDGSGASAVAALGRRTARIDVVSSVRAPNRMRAF